MDYNFQKRRISIVFLSLLILWLAFSGVFQVGMIVIAFISCVVAVIVSYKMQIISDDSNIPIYIKPKSYKYFLWLLVEIFKSGVDVTKMVWSINLGITPILSSIDSSIESEEGKTLYANSITLTPGTVCVDSEDGELEVHALTESGIKNLEKGEMERGIRTVCL